jgi:hypothetical protein
MPFVDARQTEPRPSPAQVAIERAGTDWLVSSLRAQTCLLAWFILAEDRQRRLEVRDVAPLMHQRSLVEHVMAAPDLRRVLIADEVGLGKTVEAGLIVQRLLQGVPICGRCISRLRAWCGMWSLSFAAWTWMPDAGVRLKATPGSMPIV